MRKLLIILIVLSGPAYGQHLTLQSQYLFNSVALNPATTGSDDAFSLVGSFRAQWIGLPGAPLTQSITAHAPLKKMKSAFGAQIFADQIGVTRNTGIFGSYAYRLRFENSSLAFGLAGGINMIKSHFSKLEVNDQDDEEIITDSPLAILPDVSFGMHYSGKKYFVSFSIPMFLSHEFEGSKFRLKHDFKNYNFMLGGGYHFHLKSGAKFKPSVLLKYRYDARPQADFNMMYSFNEAIDLGLSYRTEEALIALLEVRPTKQFAFMYSFGFPLNPLWKYTYGSHEFSLKYQFKYKTSITSPRYLGW